MRNRLALSALMVLMISLLGIVELRAVPAKPGLIEVEEPDGTIVKLYVKGDEFFNWRTTEGGYPVVQGEDGYLYYASYSADGRASVTQQRVAIDGVMQSAPSGVSVQNIASIAQSTRATRVVDRGVDTRSSTSGFPSEGSVRAVVILVEYSDVKFSVSEPNQAFYNQLNEEGYSVSGANGSARDYFSVNSRGVFDGQFDVYGPYTLPNERSYYGGNDDDGQDLRPDQMVWDGVALADDDVDFSLYDYNNDGYIDNVFVYYAGYNEAEGATSDSVWPHMWAVNSRPQFDGKTLYIYACTSELRGTRGTTIAGVGTFCHEFSHIFGLADHYDTDGDVSGSSDGLGFYDIMCNGSYNNSGNTPPLHNGLELDMIGWNSPITLDSTQEITIDPIQSGEVYKVLTDVDGEYFLIENRQSQSVAWDNYISASGLFITHVDRSSSYMSKWYANNPNGDTSHECFKFVVAGNSTFSIYEEKKVPYPYGSNNEWSATSSPAALSWSGAELGVEITNIVQNSDGSITFKVSTMQSLGGCVVDSSGSAISGASLTFTSNGSGGEVYTTLTDKDGIYELDIATGSYDVVISCSLYYDYYDVVEVVAGQNQFDFQMASYVESLDGLTIDVGQSEASLSWNPQSYYSFMISISGDGYSDQIDVDDCKYTLSTLEPSTTYQITISALFGTSDYVELYNDSFTTVAQITTIPLIQLDEYSYKAGESISLKMLNTSSSDQLSWYLDGVEQKSTTLTLSQGEYLIEGVVVRDSQTFRVNRYILVE